MNSEVNFSEMVAYNFGNLACACDQVPGCDSIPCNCHCDSCDCDTCDSCDSCDADCNK